VTDADDECLTDKSQDPASSLLLERDAQGEPLEEFHLVGCLRQSLVVAMIAPVSILALSTNAAKLTMADYFHRNVSQTPQ
jgi:hypothetical protein